MKNPGVVLLAGVIAGVAVRTADAQPRPASSSEQTQMRYQVGQMERVLEGAVEHGAKVWRDHFQSVLPADMLLSENAKVRGFRLDGYGILFDVEVPSLESAPLWSFRTLDQNDLGLVSALDALRTFVEKTGDLNVQQALKRVELQVGPGGTSPSLLNVQQVARPDVGAPAVAPDAAGGRSADRSEANPQEAYRADVKDALMEAMLDYSRGLEIGATEWLTIAARGSDNRPPLSPADSEARTMIIRVRGADLTAFLGGQISREDAMKRMEIREF
jgi:hypothetical protein